MESHRNFLFRHSPKSTEEELKQTLLYTAMELETTRAAAQAELTRRDNQISILNHLLNRAIKDRDEALRTSHKLLLQTGTDPVSEISGVEEDQTQTPVVETEHTAPVMLVANTPLPEKGKLLQAVIKAGPLLQTLLLAGPLPEWRNQPPAMESFEIPPVGIGCCESGGSSGSGGAGDASSSSPTRPYKFQRVAS